MFLERRSRRRTPAVGPTGTSTSSATACLATPPAAACHERLLERLGMDMMEAPDPDAHVGSTGRSPARSSTRGRSLRTRPSVHRSHLPDLQVPGDVGDATSRRRPPAINERRDDKASDHDASPFPADELLRPSRRRARRRRPRPAATGRCPRRRRPARTRRADSRSTSPPSPATMPSTARGSIWWAVERRRRRRGRPRARATDTVPGGSPRAARRRARRGRSRRAARRRGAPPGCRSPRPGRPSGTAAPARRWATSTPKPSSPMKMLPMPATSVFVAVIASGSDFVGVEVQVAAVPRCSSVAGSSSSVTARCCSPSTS